MLQQTTATNSIGLIGSLIQEMECSAKERLYVSLCLLQLFLLYADGTNALCDVRKFCAQAGAEEFRFQVRTKFSQQVAANIA